MGAFLQAILWYVLAIHTLLATILASIIVIAVSYGFELFSLITGKGHYDFMDAVASTIGGIVGMVLVLLYKI